MSRTRRAVALAVAVVVLGATAAVAESFDVGTPDGRARVGASAEGGPGGGRVGVEGHGGAYHFDNALEGGPGGGRLTNPPMAAAAGSSGIDRDEIYGPPVAHAALGTGGLTVGVSATGTLTNLSWPSPGYYEHVAYLNRTRGYPNHGAPENAGAFFGLVFPEAEGGQTWLTPIDGWQARVDQAYLNPRSGQVVTRLRNPAWPALFVTITDVVSGSPGAEVLARRIQVTGSPMPAQVLAYANMNPTTGRAPRVPSITDGVLDEASDFATTYDPEAGALLHFRPYRLDSTAATVALTGDGAEDTRAAAIGRTFGPGVYVAMVGDTEPVGHQAGQESAGLVRSEAEGTPLLDPFSDARDGHLSGSDAAYGLTAGALAWDLGDDAEATVYMSAAGAAPAALAGVSAAPQPTFTDLAIAADADWADWLADVALPDADPQTVAVATRALMLIRTAQDRVTGAIVANTTTQTPYRQDWLRDGSFFDHALLLAGKRDMVAKHNAFYRRAQSATGHWDPILCTDGAHCSAVFPFEIDSQAFGVWALTQRPEGWAESWDAIRRGADVLWGCWDPTSGLQCAASEDDSVTPSQGAQGAATVHLALRAAAEVARARGTADAAADAARWEARAEQIRVAAHQRLCSADGGCARGRQYGFWPGTLYKGAPGEQVTLDGLAAELAARVAHTEPAAGQPFQYPMEPIFALADDWVPGGPDPAARQTALEDAVRWLTHEVAEPGVLHFGERIYHEPDHEHDPRQDYLHTVGFPHVWSGAETYIAAMMVFGPAEAGP